MSGFDRGLVDDFFDAGDELMVARGWRPRRGAAQRILSVSFERPVNEEFAATAELTPGRPPVFESRLFGRRPRSGPPLHASARVGISCPAADRILRAAGERLLKPPIWTEAGNLLTPPRDASVAIATAREIQAGVAQLVELVDDVAVPFATPLANFDAFMAEVAPSDDQNADWVYPPALFAAFGRIDEARQAFERYEPLLRDAIDRDPPPFGDDILQVLRRMRRLLGGQITIEALETETHGQTT